jgi:hypothetical protein
MGHKRIYKASFFALVYSCSLTGYAWELNKDDDGIQIYTRTVEGQQLNEFKGVVTINHSIDALGTFFTDFDNLANWVYNCKKAELVKKIGDSEFFVHFITGNPWPVKDREFVLHYTIEQTRNSSAVTLRFTGESTINKQGKNSIHMKDIVGYWHFTPIGTRQTKVEYQVLADPAGTVPKWLVNQVIVDTPYYTLRNLRNHMDSRAVVNEDYEMLATQTP